MGLKIRLKRFKYRPSVEQTASVVGWYKMRRTGIIAASNRLANSVSGGSHRADLKSGIGISFDGVNDTVAVDNVSDFGLSGDFSFSWFAYVNSTQTTTTPGVLNYGDAAASGSGGTGYNISYGTASGWAVGKADLVLHWNGLAETASDVIDTDQWVHIAITYDFSETTLKYYVDGSPVHTNTSYDPSSYPMTYSGDMTFGAKDVSNPGKQYLAAFKLYNTPLSNAQVKESYLLPEKIRPTGITAAQLKFWMPFNEGNTSLDACINAVDKTKNGNPQSGAAYVTQQAGVCPQIGLYNYNVYQYFDGTQNRVTLSDNIIADETDITVMAWVMPLTITGTQTIIGSVANGIQFGLEGNKLFFKLQGGGASQTIEDNAASTGLRDMRHVAVTKNGNDYELFVDGTSVETKTFSATYTLSNVTIGSEDGGANFFKGHINEVAIFETNLTAANISDIADNTILPSDSSLTDLIGYWRNNDWIDLSTGGNNGTLVGSASEWISRKGEGTAIDTGGQYIRVTNNVLHLDGNSYAQITDHADYDITDTITLQAWVRVRDTADGDQVVICKSSGSTQHSYELTVDPASTELKFIYSTNGTTKTTVTASSVTYSASTWKHIAVTYDGATVKFYEDGALISSQAKTGAMHSGTADVYIGCLGDLSTFYDGEIAEVKVSSIAETEGNIFSAYRALRPTFE